MDKKEYYSDRERQISYEITYMWNLRNIVSQEEVVALLSEATILKQQQKFILLVMDVITELERCLQLQNALAQENLPGFEAQITNLVLCQRYILSMP